MVFDSAEIVALYIELLQAALPFVLIFWACDFVVCFLLRAAFGGRFDFKSWR